jgi:hypothetical protein
MKCCGEVVKNSVNGKEFYYCRGCKKEVVDSYRQVLGNNPDESDCDCAYVLSHAWWCSSVPAGSTEGTGF